MARPSKFKPEFVAQAEKLANLGATDAEIADFFDVDTRTLYRWKVDNEAFCHALKVGKAEADERVVQSLFRRAIGYTHADTHISNYKGDVTVTPIVKHYPPDTTACIFWLKNRQPDAWRANDGAPPPGGKDASPDGIPSTPEYKLEPDEPSPANPIL